MENLLKEFLTDEMKISYDSEKQTEDGQTGKDNEFLKHVPLFSDLDDNTINQISKSGSRKSFNKDAVVLLEHEPGSALFVIISGKVKVSRVSDDGKEVILRILNQYDFFGEMSVLDGFSRSANI